MLRQILTNTLDKVFSRSIWRTPALLVILLLLAVDIPAQDERAEVVLRVNQPIEREISAGQMHVYSFEVSAGQYLQVSVEKLGVDVSASIFTPSGQKWAEVVKSRGTQGVGTVLGIVDIAMRLRLEVKPTRRDGAGKYRVKIETRAPTERDVNLAAANRIYQEAVRLANEESTEALQLALPKYEEALRLYRAAGNQLYEAHLLNHIGETYTSLGDLQKALNFFNEAFELYKRLGDPRGQANALSDIGDTYRALNEGQKALVFYSQALSLSRTSGDRYTEARVLNSLSKLAQTWGRKDIALEGYQKALRITREIGDREGEAPLLAGIGTIYSGMGERQKALEYYTQALSIYQESGHSLGESVTLSNIGSYYNSVGDRRKALEYYNQALAVTRAIGARGEEASVLQDSAYITREQGDLAKALTLAEESIRIIESLREKFDTQDMRSAYFSTVGSYYDFYIDLLMRLHGQSPNAGYNVKAFHTSERARARSLLDTLTEARADIRQGADPALIERERLLRRLISSTAWRRMKVADGKHTTGEYIAVGRTLEALRNELQQVEAQIRRTSPRYASLKYPSAPTLREIQTGLLDADTVLLEFSLGQERSYLWVVMPDAIHSFELPKSEDIEEAARAFYSLLKEPGRWEGPERGKRSGADLFKPAQASTVETAAVLSRMLLSPAARLLGEKRLLIVGDGALQYIPFGALPDPSMSGKTGSYQPLILKHEVVHLPSASSLLTLRREAKDRVPATKTLAVLADPVFESTDKRIKHRGATTTNNVVDADGRNFALSPALVRSAREAGSRDTLGELQRLPGTRVEAERILALVPVSERKQALDFAASRATATGAEIGQYRYVHFATHGFLNSVHPEFSGIVLTLFDEQGAPQDGYLQAHEVYNLRLSADLVVLSACETGLGKEIKGEGLVGLTRGFMYAGAPRVVVSLWSVSDDATAELMTRFYSKLIKDGARPSAALREAQLSLLREERWAAPYYWAAFTLQGEWR